MLKKRAGVKGGDIITEQQFDDFELTWEWRIEPGGNNGVKYLVTEARPGAPGHDESRPQRLADPKAFDTSVIAYLWFNHAFSPDDTKDPEIDILRHLKADLPPAIVFFDDQDPWVFAPQRCCNGEGSACLPNAPKSLPST